MNTEEKLIQIFDELREIKNKLAKLEEKTPVVIGPDLGPLTKKVDSIFQMLAADERAEAGR